MQLKIIKYIIPFLLAYSCSSDKNIDNTLSKEEYFKCIEIHIKETSSFIELERFENFLLQNELLSNNSESYRNFYNLTLNQFDSVQQIINHFEFKSNYSWFNIDTNRCKLNRTTQDISLKDSTEYYKKKEEPENTIRLSIKVINSLSIELFKNRGLQLFLLNNEYVLFRKLWEKPSDIKIKVTEDYILIGNKSIDIGHLKMETEAIIKEKGLKEVKIGLFIDKKIKLGRFSEISSILKGGNNVKIKLHTTQR